MASRHFFRIGLFVVCLIFTQTTSAPVEETTTSTVRPTATTSKSGVIANTSSTAVVAAVINAVNNISATDKSGVNTTKPPQLSDNSTATVDNSSLSMENATSADNTTTSVHNSTVTGAVDGENNVTSAHTDNSTVAVDGKNTTDNSSASANDLKTFSSVSAPSSSSNVSSDAGSSSANITTASPDQTTTAVVSNTTTTPDQKIDDRSSSVTPKAIPLIGQNISTNSTDADNSTSSLSDDSSKDVGKLANLKGSNDTDTSTNSSKDTEESDNKGDGEKDDSTDDTTSTNSTSDALPIANAANSTTNASSDSTVNVSALPANVSSNLQAPRDVSNAQGKCATMFQNLSNASSTWIPEKIILNLTDGSAALSSPALFCGQMPKIMALNTTCASIGSTMTDADASASAVAQGLSSMFTTLCSNTSNTLIVNAVNGTKCSNSVVQATNKCTLTMKPDGYSYPSEMLFNIMANSSCKALGDAKGCIVSGLEPDVGCSSSQKQTVSALMDSIIQGQCGSPAVDSTTSRPASTNSAGKDTPSKPATAASQNSAGRMNLSIALLLPVVLMSLAF